MAHILQSIVVLGFMASGHPTFQEVSMDSSIKRFPAIILFICLFSVLYSGAADKRPFTIDDYAQWRSIVSTSISEDGNWVTFAYRKTKSDDEFHVKNLETDKEYKIIGASDPKFSDDSVWTAYILNLPQKEAEKLRKQKKAGSQKSGASASFLRRKNHF
jgi:hypothetical protein